ncbi:MAG TPA: hypothetical protein VIL71_22875 [Spirillospora sp.]
MSDQAADLLLAAARELRLRCHMGPLPFDADAWMRKEQECDLPRLDGGETHYHFEVRDPEYYLGTYFELGLDDNGAPSFTVGTGDPATSGPYPADMDGLRAVAAEINRFGGDSVFGPRKHIFLHRYGRKAAYEAEEAHQELLKKAMARVMPELLPPEPLPRLIPPRQKRTLWQRIRRRVRMWMI